MINLIKSSFFDEKRTKKLLVNFINKADKLSFGDECVAFEKEFSNWQQRKDCIVVNSGSSANLAILQALLNLKKLKIGDKVGFSAITWSTNVMPIIQLGLTPIPIDVSLKTLNVTSENFIQVLKKSKIDCLFITNLLGFCDDLDEVVKICKKKGIILIEDNCESLGSVYKGIKLGNFGLASTFSFYVGHHMSTIEGGAVVTNDEKLATMIRLVRAHGWDRNLSFQKQSAMRKKYKVNSTFYSRYTFYDLGYNLRPTEITGFLGRIQIKYLPKIIKKREDNFQYLEKHIYKNPAYFSLEYAHMNTISNFAFPVICKSKKTRDILVKKCDGLVEIRPIVGGDMTKQPFFGKYAKFKYALPNASLIHSQGLYFGNNPELTKKELDQIISIFSTD